MHRSSVRKKNCGNFFAFANKKKPQKNQQTKPIVCARVCTVSCLFVSVCVCVCVSFFFAREPSSEESLGNCFSLSVVANHRSILVLNHYFFLATTTLMTLICWRIVNEPRTMGLRLFFWLLLLLSVLLLLLLLLLLFI